MIAYRTFFASVAVAWFSIASHAESTSRRVTASCLPVYCLIAPLASVRCMVEVLLPPAVEPHDYQLSPADVRRLQGSQLIVLNGLGLDDWLERGLKRAGITQATKVVRLADGLQSEVIRQDGFTNAHIWMDPVLMKSAVSNLTARLVEFDPEGKTQYLQACVRMLAQLTKLDAELQSQLNVKSARPVVSWHDAQAYFFRRYQVKEAGTIELPGEQGTSAVHLKALGKAVRASGTKVLFVEAEPAPLLAKRLAQDWKLSVAVLRTVETGPLDADFYFQVLRGNAAQIARFAP